MSLGSAFVAVSTGHGTLTGAGLGAGAGGGGAGWCRAAAGATGGHTVPSSGFGPNGHA